ncbi:MAG: hypothetical protein D6696_14210 [Acidobacteria bacterium]|nr:MAG: hypothetical protein D6696_14210 [Acidobacteriota bacterium]
MNDRAKGCFKGGCIGCLAVTGLSVGMILLVGAVQISTDWGDPTPEKRNLERPLPEVPGAPDGQEQPPITLGPLPERPERRGDVAGGRLELDLQMGEFFIVPGPPGEPIRVQADYDSNAFELRENFEQHDDGGWIYKVRFASRGGFLGMMMRGGVQGGDNRVTITVPRGHPLDVVGTIGMGESEIDLGGLWVREVDLEVGMGDHFLEFRQPTPYPVDSFRVEGSMGNLELRGLGRASPKTVTVEHSMGEVFVDLEGDWRTDGEIAVDFGMGRCRLWLPENARIRVDRASVSMGDRRLDLGDDAQLPAEAPTLALKLSGSMGELDVRR